jgi:hypothetical protein
MNPLVESYQDNTAGVLSGFDLVVITGTLSDIVMLVPWRATSYHKIRLFDYPRWAELLRDELPIMLNNSPLRPLSRIHFVSAIIPVQ